jgi:cytochrome c oxidase cbb3-type subunit II
MTLRFFTLGMTASFGAAWLFAVVLPFFKTSELKPVPYVEAIDEKTGVYFPKRTGQITNGAKVYAQNGCYVCHTQVVRPTYAGNDFHRDGWAGFKADPDRGDTRRESNVFDYQGEDFAHIGLMRIGPDLSNVGSRMEKAAIDKNTENKERLGDAWTPDMTVSAESLFFAHLYNPRANVSMRWSTCPSMEFLFEKPKAGDSVPTPKGEARALVGYLMSMKKNDAVPASMNYAAPKPAEK